MTPTGCAPVGVFLSAACTQGEDAPWPGRSGERRNATPRRKRKRPRPAAKSALSEKGEKLKKTIGDVLDEIDSVLEENAEEFVKSYVQRGGE